jgi:phosphatidylglycerophosphate synthase
MTARGELAAWMVLLLLARDIYTSFAFFVVLGMGWHVHFKARFIGKTVTVLQFSTLIAALLWPALVWILLIATTIASAIAISDYTLAILAERRRLK